MSHDLIPYIGDVKLKMEILGNGQLKIRIDDLQSYFQECKKRGYTCITLDDLIMSLQKLHEDAAPFVKDYFEENK